MKRAMCGHGPANIIPIACGAGYHARTAAVPRGARADGIWRWLETLHNTTGDSHLGAYAMTGTVLNVMSFLFLGFFLGMRHATDADHVVAIATIVSRERSVASSALIGAAWGVGHTITVMAGGGGLLLFWVFLPPRVAASVGVAGGPILVLLGG